jgi:hypothetical protein
MQKLDNDHLFTYLLVFDLRKRTTCLIKIKIATPKLLLA